MVHSNGRRSEAIWNRICVDLRPLNQSIFREVYPIPKVDETLSGASKLDVNSG